MGTTVTDSLTNNSQRKGPAVNAPATGSDRELIRRVNEIYHDLQAGEFNEIHKHRHVVECTFWEAEVVPRLKMDAVAFGVDLCTGTGFVPRILLQCLPSVKMLCVDLSRNALEGARLALGENAARASFHAGDVCSLPLPDGAADWVSMNAALHHIPDPARLLAEVRRVLKPEGRFCLGYEPNAAFFDSPTVFRGERLIWHAYWYLSPSRNVSRVLRRLGIWKVEAARCEHLDAINSKLLGEGAMSSPLSLDELHALVDVHADAAASHNHSRGFSVPKIMGRDCEGFNLEWLQYYDYGGEMLRQHRCVRLLYDGLMRRVAPGIGQLFSCILLKHGNGTLT
jgi:SAM-dependent methyltransferase